MLVCPICSAAHTACVPSNPQHVVDVPTTARRLPMAKLDLYEVPHRGHTAVLKLSEDEAKSVYGGKAKKVGSAVEAEPQPVTRPPYAVDADDEAQEKAAPAPRNKARASSANK